MSVETMNDLVWAHGIVCAETQNRTGMAASEDELGCKWIAKSRIAKNQTLYCPASSLADWRGETKWEIPDKSTG